MTVADLTETQFLARLASLDPGRDGEPTQTLVVESSFFRLKSALDRATGFALFVLTLPLVVLLVALVRLTSRGPGIYWQARVGKGGRIFTMYKLRSMRIDAEASSGPTWSAAAGDPRVTWLGFWLRRLHLDELPQLYNVARGEMSLIGPRPERPEFVQFLAEQIPGYMNRLMVAPGITGLAQINLPPDSDLNSVRQKLMLDCEYIRAATLWLDLRIAMCTALRMAWIKGPIVTRLLGLERLALLPTSSSSVEEGGRSSAAAVSLASLTDQAPAADEMNPVIHEARVGCRAPLAARSHGAAESARASRC
jgi:lipopolysaccharide/colanic/teichoic acid biosynthesis glycosyltransferase